MSQTESFSSLLRVADLEGRRSRRASPDPESEKALQDILSTPLPPLDALDQAQRNKLADKRKDGSRLDRIAAALARAQPDWLRAYAANAIVKLPPSEQRLRGRMLMILLNGNAPIREGLDLIAAGLAEASGKDRPARLKAILKGIAALSELRASDAPEALQAAMGRLIEAGDAPATPKAFCELALEVVRIAKLLYPDKAHDFRLAAAPSPEARVAPLFEEPYQPFLARKGWGTALREEIHAVLWDQLWKRLSPRGHAPSRSSDQAPDVHDLDGCAARVYQIESSLRMYFGGRESLTERTRSLLTAEHPELAAEFSAMVAQQRLLLQSIRNLAALRNYKTLGAAGDIVAYDARLHDLIEGDPATVTKIRVLDPPVIRETAGGSPELLAQGEVEAYG